jgi:pimeloyl-ACP methyl ester carboxylesterase
MDDLRNQAKALLDDLKPRSPSAAPGQNLLPPDTRVDIEGPDGPRPVWRAGDGAATLFVHGWDDTHRVWRRFAMDFIQNARPVLLMDLPGHGASSLDTCNFKNAGQSVSDVFSSEGPIDAVIAHSFGCLAAAQAVAMGAKAEYLVLIAPPLSADGSRWADRQRKKGVPDNVIAAAKALYREQTGLDLDGPDMKTALSGFEGKIIFIGSEADEECPIAPMADLASSLKAAQLHTVADLSHRDLALHPEILSYIISALDY